MIKSNNAFKIGRLHDIVFGAVLARPFISIKLNIYGDRRHIPGVVHYGYCKSHIALYRSA